MTKVQLKKLKRILYIVSAVLGIVALIMMIGVSIVPDEITNVKQKIDAGFYGYDIVFGIKDGELAGLKFSFLALLPYIFALAGVVLLVFRILDKYLSKKFDFLIASLFLVSSLLFFLSGNFIVYATNLVGELFKSFDYKLSYGLIVSGVCSLISMCCVVASFVSEELIHIDEEKSKTHELSDK